MVINVTLETTKVISFNGRTGDVTAQEGDYTADMVGARADNWLPTPAEIGAVTTGQLSDKIKYGTLDIGTGASLATGSIYLVYK